MAVPRRVVSHQATRRRDIAIFEHPQQRRLVQRVSTAELLLPAECLPEAAAA